MLPAAGFHVALAIEVTLLEPAADFVPPAYLGGRAGGKFIERAELGRRWRGERPTVLVSDPMPEPFVVLARFGDRWVLGNQATGR